MLRVNSLPLVAEHGGGGNCSPPCHCLSFYFVFASFLICFFFTFFPKLKLGKKNINEKIKRNKKKGEG